MQRLEILDGLRGYFLTFMMLNHMVFTGGYRLVRINHGELGYVQDAQGFVFLSGLLVGMVYGRRMRRNGFSRTASKIWKRAFEIYRYAIACLIVVVALAAFLPNASEVWRPWLWELGDHDPVFMVSAALMLFQPTYMDILPQYVAYMVAAPPLLAFCVQGRWRIVAIASVALWTAIQLGLHYPLADLLHAGAGAVRSPDAFRVYFNPLAWQLCFFSGMVLGYLTIDGTLDWATILHPERTVWVKGSLILLGLFAVHKLATTFELFPESMKERLVALDFRNELSLVFALNFVVLAYVMAWILIAGPRSAHRKVRKVAAFFRALFSLRFLRFIGRHSLQVYAWHVIVVYLIHYVDHRYGPFHELLKTAIALVAVASLAIPAYLHERYSSWRAGGSGPPNRALETPERRVG